MSSSRNGHVIGSVSVLNCANLKTNLPKEMRENPQQRALGHKTIGSHLKGKVSMTNCNGSIYMGLAKSSEVFH